MPTTLTTQQILWASQHDWFIKDNGNGTIVVADRDDLSDRLQTWVGTFRQLREWAGY